VPSQPLPLHFLHRVLSRPRSMSSDTRLSGLLTRSSTVASLRRSPARPARHPPRHASASASTGMASLSSYLPSDTYRSLPKDGDLTFLHTMLRVSDLVGRCRMTASHLVFEAHMVSALEDGYPGVTLLQSATCRWM
jgi:hypothetical protein